MEIQFSRNPLVNYIINVEIVFEWFIKVMIPRR